MRADFDRRAVRTAGNAECWLVGPESKTVRVYVLAGNAYKLSVQVGTGQIARSATIAGFEVPLDDIFADA